MHMAICAHKRTDVAERPPASSVYFSTSPLIERCSLSRHPKNFTREWQRVGQYDSSEGDHIVGDAKGNRRSSPIDFPHPFGTMVDATTTVAEAA